MKLKFLLLSNDGTFFEKSAEKVVMKTSDGEICILPNHAKYLSEITEGKIRVDEKSLFTNEGFVSAKENEVKVFVGMAQVLDDLKGSDVDEMINEILSIPEEKRTPYLKKKLEWLRKLKEELKRPP